MLIQDVLIFIVIQLAMIFFGYAEAYQEGSEGWKWNPKWWRIRLPKGYWYHAYHIFIYYLTFPLLIFALPIILVGWDTHLILVLLISYLIGTIIEDFTWFLVNKDYPFKKWNPKDTRWYPWIRIFNFSLPLSYVSKFIISLIFVFFVIKDYLR